MPQAEVPGPTFVPDTEEATRRASSRAPLCPDGTRALALRRADEDVPEYNIVAGDEQWMCLTYGVVYPRPIADAVLLDVLFPDEWSIVPPG